MRKTITLLILVLISSGCAMSGAQRKQYNRASKAGIVASVLMAPLAMYLIRIDGRGTCPERDVVECPHIYNTDGSGMAIGYSAVGILGLIFGVGVADSVATKDQSNGQRPSKSRK